MISASISAGSCSLTRDSATATKFFEFIVFAFSESLSGTYSPDRAVLSNKRGKMDFFKVFSETFWPPLLNYVPATPYGLAAL